MSISILLKSLIAVKQCNILFFFFFTERRHSDDEALGGSSPFEEPIDGNSDSPTFSKNSRKTYSLPLRTNFTIPISSMNNKSLIAEEYALNLTNLFASHSDFSSDFSLEFMLGNITGNYTLSTLSLLSPRYQIQNSTKLFKNTKMLNNAPSTNHSTITDSSSLRLNMNTKKMYNSAGKNNAIPPSLPSNKKKRIKSYQNRNNKKHRNFSKDDKDKHNASNTRRVVTLITRQFLFKGNNEERHTTQFKATNQLSPTNPAYSTTAASGRVKSRMSRDNRRALGAGGNNLNQRGGENGHSQKYDSDYRLPASSSLPPYQSSRNAAAVRRKINSGTGVRTDTDDIYGLGESTLSPHTRRFSNHRPPFEPTNATSNTNPSSNKHKLYHNRDQHHHHRQSTSRPHQKYPTLPVIQPLQQHFRPKYDNNQLHQSGGKKV